MYSYDAEYGLIRKKVRKHPFKNKLLKFNGHHPCQVNTNFENVHNSKVGNIFSILYFNLFMACSLNRRTMLFFRSLKFVDEEHIRQRKQFFVIHPYSIFRTYWNTIMIIVYIAQFITIPMDLIKVLKEHIKYNFEFGFMRNFLNFMCWIDMVLNCFTGYCSNTRFLRKTVLSNWKILRHYLFTYFIFDLLATLVIHNYRIVYLDDKSRNNSLKIVIYFLMLLKFARLSTFYQYCQDFHERYETTTTRFVMYRLIIRSLLYLILINAVACLSAILAQVTFTEDQFFFHTIFVPKHPNVQQSEMNYTFLQNYECYIYQATLLMTTTGMGLRNPTKNYKTEVYVLSMWFLSKFLYWVFVASVIQLFAASTSSKRKYVEKVQELKEYINYKKLPQYLKNRLLTYYEFGFQKTYFHENEIFNALTGRLREEINMHSCKKLVENVTFFKNIPTTLFVRIVAGLKYEIFMTNDVIAKCGTIGDEMYFLASGTVAIYSKSGKEICHLDDGNHFGEIAMVMSNELRIASVVAIETCEMYRLDRVDFIRAILPFPDLLEKMQHVAAERLEKTALMDEST